DGGGDALLVGVRDHAVHQLPEAPPPPNEPPPPEKPPPKPPDEPPQDEPDEPHEPGIGINIGPLRLRRPPGPARGGPCRAMLLTMIKKITTKNRIVSRSAKPGWSSGRRLARAFHSAASTDTAWMMSSTPRMIPPAKSPTRKRGRMEFSMMSRETPSVSVPSKP